MAARRNSRPQARSQSRSRKGTRSRSSRYRRSAFGSTAVGRSLTALVSAIIVGVIGGIILPWISPTIGKVTGSYTAVGNAADTLNTLTVVDNPSPSSRYDRDAFGFRSTDDDGDGCDVREAVLKRDMTNVTFTKAGGCKVKTGTLDDPYTGKQIAFTRGVKTSTAVQIDHVVALENAWKSGASEWQSSQRVQFANDMYNLLAVDGPTNENKGSASAAAWLPPNKAYQCAYVARQIGVKAKYGLTVTGDEKLAMQGVLHTCPGQAVPQS